MNEEDIRAYYKMLGKLIEMHLNEGSIETLIEHFKSFEVPDYYQAL